MSSGQLKYERFIVDLTREYRPQREWAEGRGLYLIIGHFLVGVASGAWIYGHLFNHPASLVCAYFLAAVGGLCHLINLGRPERFWRMMRRARTSWIARGFWGISFFLVSGTLLLPSLIFSDQAWAVHPTIVNLGESLGWLGAVIMIGYMGFAYMVSKAIPFWNSPLHPILYIAYALRGGAGLMLLLAPAYAVAPALVSTLLQSWVWITTLVIALWGVEAVAVMSSGDGAARRSFYELFQGSLVGYVYIGILLLGLAVPVFLLSGVALPHSVLTLALVGLTSVIGDLFMKLSSVKAGMYIPVRLEGAQQRR